MTFTRQLLAKAHEIDAETFAKNCIAEDEQRQISEWNNKVDELCKSMKRTEVPTKFDFEKLEAVMFYFKK